MQPSSDTPEGGMSRQLRRYGPLAAIVVVIAVVAAVVAFTGGDDDGGDDQTAASTTTGGQVAPPEGAITFSQAREQNLDVTFGPSCDQETGRIAMPYYFRSECYADVAENGGATSDGVTGDTIKVVIYLAQEDDLILKFITGPLQIDDTNAESEATYRGFAAMYEQLYQLYGRRVEFEVLRASGLVNDEVAARADAVTAAEDMGAFAVWGGPVLSTAWADELAARNVICMGCLTGSSSEWFEQRAPYVFQVGMSGEQFRAQLVEYLSKQVANRPAAFAGDPAMQAQQRKLGLLYIESNEESTSNAEALKAELADAGVTLDPLIPYTLEPQRLAEQATSVIAQLKAAGVTSVIFQGDPIAPATFTPEATAQGYFPEWILGNVALADTTTFARTYDQQQWAHAFGISQLTARTPTEVSGAYQLYQWFNGEPPPAVDTVGVLFPQPALFYAAVQAAGPELTPETFRDGLFAIDPTPSVLTNVSISFGDHGIWPTTDYSGIDDVTETWYDPAAVGPDEIRKVASGMWQYTDGGKRYKPGEWPERDTRAFDRAGAVALYDEVPESEAAPDYPPPGG